MRSSRVAAAPTPLGDRPHVCAAYQDAAEFGRAALSFAEQSLREGFRLLCVGAAAEEAAGLLPDADRHRTTGRLTTFSADEVYSTDSTDRLAFYSSRTERALADGYAGLAVLAEVTPAARRSDLWNEHVRWEQQADAFIASGSGMTALCGYHRPELGADALADMEATHPQVWSQAPTGHSFRAWSDADRLMLAGEVDRFGVARLRRILDFRPVHGPATTVLDLSGLTFVDASGTMTIGRWAAADDARRIVRAPEVFLRVWRILGWQERLGCEVASTR